ncbi:diacylglycerol kinase family protein [Novosphingobium mangrovi (ex Huang et al. 2023)]|uniref:Diacylglycerol kinase family protein n=1 Tax=Novosphingobium mangrovi (ex Huang et al. 2023) TaxID=2976432 RepID=A0ABT2I199_9SPHN|nr:diacylglycerol kinase family protein [Novosphingobium mangrovi (ex Huang et al. 2023)]MCT2398574.1 diacylglycerol kinase family protein [Novosphingobium mangrovi (ex Huang et al. 2023)]
MHGTIYEFDTLPTFGKNARPGQTGPERPARRGRAVPLVGIVRNPRSHRNKGHAPEMADCSNILTETPRTREELYYTLAGFARRDIDYLVVDGGDGTVRDVLSCGSEIFGGEWPTLIVLPKGKTNALTVDLGLPNHWSLADALAAAHKGNTITRRPLRISPAEGSVKDGCIQGFILGTGAFSIATEAGQEAHRRGAFNSFAVGLTVLWAIIQSLFGRTGNPWRTCTPTRIVDRHTGRDLPHSGRGRSDERFMTVATTFEKFPLGARPFGRNPVPGLKLAVIDWPVRWIIALLPAVLFGFYSRSLTRNGAQRFHANDLELDIGGSFVLDGEVFPAGRYVLDEGPQLTFVVP